jgi:hypothetical protein
MILPTRISRAAIGGGPSSTFDLDDFLKGEVKLNFEDP